MRGSARPLLCELHAHTTWSDGELSLGAVVDLYGRAGFDVLCITDHVLRGDDPWPVRHGRPCVDATYLNAFLADNDPDPERAAHAVAVGLQGLVSMDDGPAAAMETARAAGAAILGCAPARLRADTGRGWTTLVPCEQDEEALVDYLRSPRPVFLTRLEEPAVAVAA
jgi:hypothetical protein